jgi:transposase
MLPTAGPSSRRSINSSSAAKALIGNSAYRRYYLRTTIGSRAFEIDPGKLAEEARFDGIFVLRSNARITPLQAVLRYRDLLQVEDLFRTAKALMRTRPIYHSSGAAIRGHVFCPFLALVLRKELDERCRMTGFRPGADVLRDLEQQAEPVLAGQIVGRRIVLHIDERVGHRRKAEAAQALGHGVDQHGGSLQW